MSSMRALWAFGQGKLVKERKMHRLIMIICIVTKVKVVIMFSIKLNWARNALSTSRDMSDVTYCYYYESEE